MATPAEKYQVEKTQIAQRSRELELLLSRLSPEDKAKLLDSLTVDIAHNQAVFETLEATDGAGAKRAIFDTGNRVLNIVADKLHLSKKRGVRFLG